MPALWVQEEILCLSVFDWISSAAIQYKTPPTTTHQHHIYNVLQHLLLGPVVYSMQLHSLHWFFTCTLWLGYDLRLTTSYHEVIRSTYSNCFILQNNQLRQKRYGSSNPLHCVHNLPRQKTLFYLLLDSKTKI